MAKGENGRARRSVKNFLLDSKLQGRYVFFLIALLLTVAFMMSFFLFKSLSDVMEAIAVNSPISDQLQASIDNASHMSWSVFLISTVFYVVIACMIGLVITHRFYGPMVPLKRQAKAILDGDYKARVRLRQNDEFQELADLLNAVAEKFEKKNQ